jgi:type VI secretion system protein ImpA
VIEDDIEVRAAAFNWLDDPDRGARFPTTVRKVPLVRVGEDDGYGWFTWKQVQDGRGQVTAEQFEKAVMNTPVAFSQLVVEDVRAALGELDQLTESLTTRMADVAPTLMDLRKALDECQTLAQQIRQRKGPVLDSVAEAPPAPAAGAEAVAPAAPAAGAAVTIAAPARAMRTRDDVYRQLNEAANLLQQMEPHSPIPYLILKAVELGAMPFPQLMKALIRNEEILTEMNRELGIKDASPPPTEE